MKCSFCSIVIKEGTGVQYVRNDGTVYFFCSKKCRTNQLKLKRKASKLKWTR